MSCPAKKVLAEAQRIAQQANGRPMHPEKLVSWAKKNPSSALYEYFEWDDGRAAHQHRLSQARYLIRQILITPAETGQPMRAFVSIHNDRINGGGYRPLGEVMGDSLMANQIILEALREAKRWSFKYQHLQQLRDIHKAIEKVAGKLEDGLVAKTTEPAAKKNGRRAVAA